MKKKKSVKPEELFYLVPFPPNSIIKDVTVFKMMEFDNDFKAPYFWAAGSWHESSLSFDQVEKATQMLSSVNPQA